jgi:hypothetical protein
VRSLPAVLVLVGSLACSAAGEVPGAGVRDRRPSDRWTIDFTLSLSERPSSWVFVVHGTTDLPAATVLRARVYAYSVLSDPILGPRDDDEPLVREDDEVQPPFDRFTAKSGFIHEDVHAFRRKPYSIRYRAKIHYFPEDQTEAIRLKVGDEPFFRQAELRVGTEDSYARELKERLAEATTQLLTLEKLGLELRDLAFRRPWDAAAWERWKGPAGKVLDGIRDENRRRFALWAVWIEGQCRMRIGALGEFLQHVVDAVEEGEAVRDEPRVRTLLKGYFESVEEACDAIGADVPLNPLAAAPVLAAYDRALSPLRAPSPSASDARRARAGAVAALGDLAPLVRVRRRGYAALNAMAAQLAQLYDLGEAKTPASELDRAWRAHDAAEREFRSFARLP